MKKIKSLLNKTSLIAVLIIFSCQPEEITYIVKSTNGIDWEYALISTSNNINTNMPLSITKKD